MDIITYFDLLPKEILGLIFYNVKDFETFDRLYAVKSNLINEVLSSDKFWNNITRLKVLGIISYKEPTLQEDPKNIKEFKFYTYLAYYIKAINTKEKVVKTFHKFKDYHNLKHNKHFLGKSDEYIRKSKDDYEIILQTVYDSKRIKFNPVFLDDLSLFLKRSGYKSIKNLARAISSSHNFVDGHFYVNAYGYGIAFVMDGMINNYELSQSELKSMLYRLYYNGHEEINF